MLIAGNFLVTHLKDRQQEMRTSKFVPKNLKPFLNPCIYLSKLRLKPQRLMTKLKYLKIIGKNKNFKLKFGSKFWKKI